MGCHGYLHLKGYQVQSCVRSPSGLGTQTFMAYVIAAICMFVHFSRQNLCWHSNRHHIHVHLGSWDTDIDDFTHVLLSQVTKYLLKKSCTPVPMYPCTHVPLHPCTLYPCTPAPMYPCTMHPCTMYPSKYTHRREDHCVEIGTCS